MRAALVFALLAISGFFVVDPVIAATASIAFVFAACLAVLTARRERNKRGAKQ